MKHFLSTLVLAFAALISLQAQTPCTNYPEIKYDEVKGVFFVDFKGSCFVNPPQPLDPNSEIDKKRAKWTYLWIIDDGFVSFDSSFVYTEPGEHEVMLAMRPIYSGDDEPPIRRKKIRINNGGGGTHARFSFFKPGIQEDARVDFQLDAARPKDTLITFISVRKIQHAHVQISFDKDDFTYVEGDMARGKGILEPEVFDMQAGDATHTERRVVSWPVDLQDMTDTVGEKIILRLVVNEITDLPDAGKQLSIGLGVDKTVVPGTYSSRTGDEPNVVIINSNYLPIASEQAISANKSRDPNQLVVVPTIAPVDFDEFFNILYEIHFANVGGAQAKNLMMTLSRDRRISSPRLIKFVPYRTNLPILKREESTATETITWNNIFLPGIPPDSVNGNEGHVSIVYSPEKVKFKPGDQLKASALIKMDGDSLRTDTVVTTFRTFRGMPLPWAVGFKLSWNWNGDNNRRGPQAAFTFRKGLSRIKDAGWRNRYLRIQHPTWWWQGELGAGMSCFEPEGKATRLYHLDVSPVTIMKVGPPLKHAQIPFLRKMPLYWAVSAGYMASYVYKGIQNEQNVDLQQYSFGDRIIHSFILSAEIGNILGRNGLSVGGSVKFRNVGIFDNFTGIDTNLAVYIHYNIGYLWNKKRYK